MTGLPILLEGAVALLLLITVAYCILLERRMRAFNEGRESLRDLVADLDRATTRAEQAIAGLAVTTREAHQELDQRIGDARSLTRSLALIAHGAGQAGGRRPAPARFVAGGER